MATINDPTAVKVKVRVWQWIYKDPDNGKLAISSDFYDESNNYYNHHDRLSLWQLRGKLHYKNLLLQKVNYTEKEIDVWQP